MVVYVSTLDEKYKLLYRYGGEFSKIHMGPFSHIYERNLGVKSNLWDPWKKIHARKCGLSKTQNPGQKIPTLIVITHQILIGVNTAMLINTPILNCSWSWSGPLRGSQWKEPTSHISSHFISSRVHSLIFTTPSSISAWACPLLPPQLTNDSRVNARWSTQWMEGGREAPLNYHLYRDRLKGVQILLSNSQAGSGRIVKQEQEEISRNHVQAF